MSIIYGKYLVMFISVTFRILSFRTLPFIPQKKRLRLVHGNPCASVA